MAAIGGSLGAELEKHRGHVLGRGNRLLSLCDGRPANKDAQTFALVRTVLARTVRSVLSGWRGVARSPPHAVSMQTQFPSPSH